MQRNSRMPQAWRSNATPKSLELNRSGNSLRHVCHQPWLTLDAVRPSQLSEAKHRAKKECKNGLGFISHKILVKWYQTVCILYLYEVQSREDVEIVLQSGQDETNKWRDQQTTPFCRTKMNKQRREMQKKKTAKYEIKGDRTRILFVISLHKFDWLTMSYVTVVALWRAVCICARQLQPISWWRTYYTHNGGSRKAQQEKTPHQFCCAQDDNKIQEQFKWMHFM